MVNIRSQIFPERSLRVEKTSKKLADGEVLGRLESHFDRWDANGNGQISWTEIRDRVADPQCRGEEAVALATLYGLLEQDAAFRGMERKAPVSFERLGDLYYEYTDEEDDTPQADGLYQKYEAKLKESTDELFPHGLPNGHLGKQGTGPSCGFLAATFAQLVKDPGVVREAVSQTEDGLLQVKFPGLEKAITISPATDTQQALFATAGQNGSWLTNLEKAWGTHTAGGDESRAFEVTTNPEDAIVAWTAGQATTARIPKNPATFPKGELPDYLKATSRELAADHMAVAWTRYEGFTVEGFVPGHAYTLTGIDHRNGTVSLRNPWGRQEPGNENGPFDGQDDGLFELPLAEFHKNFAKIARQTS